MFNVYAVKFRNGAKQRFFIDSTELLFQAKHIANACTCGDADYAYVKDSQDGMCVFWLGRPDPNPYDERPLTEEERLNPNRLPLM